MRFSIMSIVCSLALAHAASIPPQEVEIRGTSPQKLKGSPLPAKFGSTAPTIKREAASPKFVFYVGCSKLTYIPAPR